MNNYIDLRSARQISSKQFIYNDEIIFVKDFNLWEIVAEKIAKELNINSVHYEIGYLRGKYVLFSKSFYTKDEKFISGNSLLAHYQTDLNMPTGLNVDSLNNLTDIWIALEEKFGPPYLENIKIVMSDLVKMFCFDILLNLDDRHNCNWGIVQSSNHIRLAPIYDNVKAKDNKKIEFNISIDSDNFRESRLVILEEFLKYSDSSFTEVFYEMYDILTVLKFEEILKSVEKGIINIKDKSLHISEFASHRDKLEAIVEKYRGRKM